MADEQKTETTQTEETKSGKVVFETQEDFDSVIQNRLAKERSKYSDYEQTKAELEKLRQAQKEREEQELSELEKARRAIDELEASVSELTPFKEKEIKRLQAVEQKVEAAQADLSDEDKALISTIPDPDGKLALINRLTESKKEPLEAGYNGGKGLPKKSIDEMMTLSRTNPKKFQEIYADWKNSR